MGGRNRQPAFLLRHQVLANAFDIVNVAKDLARVLNNGAACRRNANQALALAREYLHTELLLQLPQLLADARLAGVQAFCGRRNVEAVIHNAKQVFELFQCHVTVLNVSQV